MRSQENTNSVNNMAEADESSDNKENVVNEVDYPNEQNDEGLHGLFDDIKCDLPDKLMVTNVDISVYENDNSKAEFEKFFMVYDENATFQYFKSFRRARVNYSSPVFAARARLDLDGTEVCGQNVNCFFLQTLKPGEGNRGPHLHPPVPTKQFLISPPASPPVGWEQQPEAEPVLNLDLLSAVVQLAPGEAHELHPPSENQPAIVVHICEDPEGYTPVSGSACNTRTGNVRELLDITRYLWICK
ncbi:hypothetical protein ACJMK2_030274 [Sinanodonta woodiana]|uniref:Protein sarah n=1 Tax=Sinanodonta woodiana TaxID=1069815 RepID=A0ABD3XEQ4_SINWO